MDYIEITIELKERNTNDIFEAELAEIGFESFLVEGLILKGYISADQYDEAQTQDVINQYASLFTTHSKALIPHTNWNAEWESNYEPVFIDERIFVHAPFHQPNDKAELNIILEPNMSFGTGHHPTTHMMLSAMSDLNLAGQHVADFGCGSGILAIYAAFKGARGVGIEIDSNAADAARENLRLNNVSSFEIITGALDTLVSNSFDLILANINRNVIEESVSTFSSKLNPGGRLLCAGFLDADAEGISNALAKHGLMVYQETSQNGWKMLATQKTT